MCDSGQEDISSSGDKRKAEKMSAREKSQKKPWGTDGPPPPEWIEMAQKKKTERMALRKKRRIERGLPNPRSEFIDTFNHNFIQRPMLRIPGLRESSGPSNNITIMTYNVLAQSLIRRNFFPSSGDTLKWRHRSRMLTNELTHYQPTILCLQEVDLEQYEPYFVQLLRSLQYDHVLLAAKRKRQGLLVAWKEEKYELVHRTDIHYDLLNAGTVGPTMWTGNVGVCLGLKQKDSECQGIWVSNTHLYWHPRGSYERQRQAGVLVSESMKFSAKEPKWPAFICGDFNSTPWGMTYTALTQRPIQLTSRQEEELRESVAYDFRQVKDEEEEIADDNDFTPIGTSTPEHDAENMETEALSETMPVWKTKEYLQQQLFVKEEVPLNITPATMENNALVLQHHTSNPPLKSLYAEGLKFCQPDNAINAYGEPPFTNWAEGYRETLDYIFLLEKEDSKKVKLLGLLKMPKIEEMGGGEPREGRFPSDHVCEIAELELS